MKRRAVEAPPCSWRKRARRRDRGFTLIEAADRRRRHRHDRRRGNRHLACLPIVRGHRRCDRVRPVSRQRANDGARPPRRDAGIRARRLRRRNRGPAAGRAAPNGTLVRRRCRCCTPARSSRKPNRSVSRRTLSSSTPMARSAVVLDFRSATASSSRSRLSGRAARFISSCIRPTRRRTATSLAASRLAAAGPVALASLAPGAGRSAAARPAPAAVRLQRCRPRRRRRRAARPNYTSDSRAAACRAPTPNPGAHYHVSISGASPTMSVGTAQSFTAQATLTNRNAVAAGTPASIPVEIEQTTTGICSATPPGSQPSGTTFT